MTNPTEGQPTIVVILHWDSVNGDYWTEISGDAPAVVAVMVRADDTGEVMYANDVAIEAVLWEVEGAW